MCSNGLSRSLQNVLELEERSGVSHSWQEQEHDMGKKKCEQQVQITRTQSLQGLARKTQYIRTVCSKV